MSGLSFKLTSSGKRLWLDVITHGCLWLFYQVAEKNAIHTKKKKRVRFQVSVDFKDAEDVRRGRRVAHSVEFEGRARDGLQLRAFVQSQEAGHLAGLQEVERVRPGWGGRPITLYALQLLRPQASGHHVQLHILRLLLVEQHLRKRRGWSH